MEDRIKIAKALAILLLLTLAAGSFYVGFCSPSPWH